MAELPSGRGIGAFCVQTAPILAWCRGRSDVWLRAEFQRKAWKASIVRDIAPAPDRDAGPAACVAPKH